MATLHRAHAQTRASPAFEDEHNYSAVMFETEDGRTTSKSSRMMKDPDTSSNENIRYQAMDMIKKDTRKSSASASRSNSLNTGGRRYYSSWDNLLERSEVRQSKTNLLASQNFGSTGSVNSATSEAEKGTSVGEIFSVHFVKYFVQIQVLVRDTGGGRETASTTRLLAITSSYTPCTTPAIRQTPPWRLVWSQTRTIWRIWLMFNYTTSLGN